MSKRLNVAVIGAGDMGGNHVKGWIALGHHVASITDIDIENANKLANLYNIPKIFTDYEKAVSDPIIDIVSVCLPLKYHGPVTIFAAQQGKHIFCEKPLASSIEVAEEMELAVRKAGVKFGLGFQRNLANGVSLIQKWNQEGKFGRPLVINSDLLQEVRPKIAMHDRDGNQGPIVDTCCHFFLMWQTIFQSKPISIYARGGILAKDRPEIAHFKELAIDTAVITIEYESGDIGTMTISWGLAKKTKLKSHHDRLIGPEGGVEGPFNSIGTSIEITLYSGDEEEVTSLDHTNLFQKQFELFVDAIENDKPAPVSFQQGKDMLKLSYAVLESIETNRPVIL